MNLQTLETDLGYNAKKLEQDLISDFKAECTHIADPSQCGSIVRRHFDGIMVGIYTFVLGFMAIAGIGIYLYMR